MNISIQTKPRAVILLSCLAALFFTSACSTNPATGKSQFAALMSPQQELSVGAQEHEKIVAQFGLYEDKAITDYVTRVGNKVARDTERPDITYKFYVLDSPIVNAFALPGGYVYISRGLLALANNEAELAGVLGHEIGHITGRHSAERYSHGVVGAVGSTVLSILLDNNLASQALDIGNNVYLSSYSRGQENEADTLGIRYMTRAGYDAAAMTDFLASLKSYSELEDKANNRESKGVSYLSTHPATGDRVQKTKAEAQAAGAGKGILATDAYLNTIDGVTFGDSRKQGFVRGDTFYHPEIGFKFDVPNGFKVQNQPTQIAMVSADKSEIMIFDMDRIQGDQKPREYISYLWMKDQKISDIQSFEVNAMPAASARFSGMVNNRASEIILVAIEWKPKNYARFQIAVPQSGADAAIKGMMKTPESFIELSAAEKESLKPDYVDVFTAKGGEDINTVARAQTFKAFKEEYFRVLNALPNTQKTLTKERRYKRVVAP